MEGKQDKKKHYETVFVSGGAIEATNFALGRSRKNARLYGVFRRVEDFAESAPTIPGDHYLQLEAVVVFEVREYRDEKHGLGDFFYNGGRDGSTSSLVLFKDGEVQAIKVSDGLPETRYIKRDDLPTIRCFNPDG